MTLRGNILQEKLQHESVCPVLLCSFEHCFPSGFLMSPSEEKTCAHRTQDGLKLTVSFSKCRLTNAPKKKDHHKPQKCSSWPDSTEDPVEEHLREKKKEAPWKVKEAWREQESGSRSGASCCDEDLGCGGEVVAPGRVAQQQLGSCSHPPPPHTPALCARHPRLPEVLQQLPWLTVTLCFLATVASEMFPEMTLALCQVTASGTDCVAESIFLMRNAGF
nr:uncharacterized protein LOC105484035 [Macaca nemestrina]